MDHERLNLELNDPQVLREYCMPYDGYKVSWLPKFLGGLLIKSGNLVYGKRPSYLKFRALEIVARVPYHSWESAAYTLLTLFFWNSGRAMALSQTTHFARVSQDNETMHVVVISHLFRKHGKPGIIRHTILPMLFAFIYFWILYVLYFMSKKQSLELNYLFEDHAFRQYDEFIRNNEHALTHETIDSDFLRWYGRNPINEYEFFRSVRNDELIHRNASAHQILSLHTNKSEEYMG